jgi:hypothetical protein
MWRLVSALLVWSSAACSRASSVSSHPLPSGPSSATLDSIHLERTLCYGTCPAYRLALDRAGRVRFWSLNPGDLDRTAQDSLSPEALLYLEREAERIGFFALPDSLEGSDLCADWATDHPTVTVTLFGPRGRKRVADYHGCFERSDHSVKPVVGRLRTFERMIDGVVGSFRWVRPAQRR